VGNINLNASIQLRMHALGEAFAKVLRGDGIKIINHARILAPYEALPYSEIVIRSFNRTHDQFFLVLPLTHKHLVNPS
jgi:hypothetical protein